jgi:hypothetical protein
MIKKIKIFFSLFLVLVLLLGALAYYDVKGGPNVRIFEKLGINFKVPIKIRTFLKETIFYLPNLQNENKVQKARLEELKNLRRHLTDLWFLTSDTNFENTKANFLKKKNIKSNLNNYELKLFSLPFYRYSRYVKESLFKRMSKPIGYLEQTNDHVILATGNGIFFYFEKERVKDLVANQNLLLKYNDLELKTIKTNISEVIKNDRIFNNSDSGIRDLMILGNKIYVSYNETPNTECFNTLIMVADLNLDNLIFSEFFTYNECVSDSNKKVSYNPVNAGSVLNSGGKMFSYKNGKILFTTGTYMDSVRAQNADSMFGKILLIDLKTKKFQTMSMGHRNPQGLFYDKKNDVIISTEHGPRGGDEININLKTDNETIENFGWPISSYGVHYGGVETKEAPLYKSHKDHGFIEPIKYFVPSIAISEIIKIPKTFNEEFINDFFIGSMGTFVGEGDLSIHHIRLNSKFDTIDFEDIIPIGQRVRDLILLEKQKIVISILENTPAIAFLILNN